jgi:hypothetical protein
MISLVIRRLMMALGACAMIFATTACNPNRNNPNYNASQTQQPGTASSPGMSGNTGSLSGAGDTSNTGASSSTGGYSGSTSGSSSGNSGSR